MATAWSSASQTSPTPPSPAPAPEQVRAVKDEDGRLRVPEAALLFRDATYFMSRMVGTDGKPLRVAWHHRKWMRLLVEHLRLAFLAPRDHSKSWTVIIYLLWRAWRHNRDPHTGVLDPDMPEGVLSMLHLTSTLDVSLVQAQVMQELVVANQHLFGDITPPEALGAQRTGKERRRWSARHARLINGADLLFKSIGSTTRGLHPQVAVLDDVLREETTATDYQRQKMWRRFMGAIEPMVPPDGQLVVTGTAFHYGDLLHRLRRTPGWQWRKYQALDLGLAADGTTRIRETRALWPGRYSVQQLLDKRATDPLMFAREYQNDPRDDASSLLPHRLTSKAVRNGAGLTFLQGLHPTSRDLQREFVVISGDFALSQQVGADYCVVFVVRYDVVTGERRLLHVTRERGLDLDSQVLLVANLCTRFAVDLGVVEENAFQRWLKDRLDRHPITSGRIVGHTTGIEKQTMNEGVPLLVPVLEQGLWTVPDGVDRETGTIIDASARTFAATWQAECNAFGWVNDKLQGAGEHDDTVIATWLAERAIRLLLELMRTPAPGAIVRADEVGLGHLDTPIGGDWDEGLA